MNSNVIHSTYHVQNGCYNCKHVFKLVEYDVEDKHFCMKNSTDRPVSGSCLMGESFRDVLIEKGIDICDDSYKSECKKLQKEWDNWARTHAVADSGICDDWSK